jgi:dTDP-4-amino-4,6-dideoxyglucose formyltransferase
LKNYLLFINGNLGLRILRYILSQGDVTLHGVVLNSIKKRKKSYFNEVKSELRNSKSQIIEFEENQDTYNAISNLLSITDFGVSALFGHKIPIELLSTLKGELINLHPSLLPIGRGADPIPWSIIDQQKQGITIHQIDSDLDTGQILFQKEIQTNISMNSGEIYDVCMSELFQEFICIRPQWEEKKIKTKRQDEIKTKIRNSTELNNRRIINEDEMGTFGDFLRIMQAASFSDGRRPMLKDNFGKLWEVNISIRNWKD